MPAPIQHPVVVSSVLPFLDVSMAFHICQATHPPQEFYENYLRQRLVDFEGTYGLEIDGEPTFRFMTLRQYRDIVHLLSALEKQGMTEEHSRLEMMVNLPPTVFCGKRQCPAPNLLQEYNAKARQLAENLVQAWIDSSLWNKEEIKTEILSHTNNPAFATCFVVHYRRVMYLLEDEQVAYKNNGEGFQIVSALIRKKR